MELHNFLVTYDPKNKNKKMKDERKVNPQRESVIK